MDAAPDEAPLQDIEIELFVRALQLRYGYDFTQYAPASFRRRVQGLVSRLQLRNIAQLTEYMLHQPDAIDEIIARLSVPVSDMFRDPDVFARLRRDVLPLLASYPHITVWQAGCAHGEEVYSLAILLREAGLYERSQIFATDISGEALAVAREGIYPARELPNWASNYLQAGGTGTLTDYFHARYGHIKLDEDLRRNVIFAEHNLATDAAFCEAQLILCRNVLIYFRRPLQQRALGLFHESLVRGGFLCLGRKESMGFTGHADVFSVLDASAALFRKRDILAN